MNGMIDVLKHLPLEIGIKLGRSQVTKRYSLSKDRIVFDTQSVTSGTTTSLSYFDGAPNSDGALSDYEKAKTLVSIPNASVILAAKAYDRETFTNTEWETVFHGGYYEMKVQTGGEFVTVDRGTLANLAATGTHQPDIQTSTANNLTLGYNNRRADWRWFIFNNNKIVPAGETFSTKLTWSTAPTTSTAGNHNLSIALLIGEYVPLD